jgi:integrase
VSEKVTLVDVHTSSETRICDFESQQLVFGDGPNEGHSNASLSRKGRSGGTARTRDRSGKYLNKVRNPMGKYPFTVVVNRLLAETDSWYSESTRAERRRKMRRIHDILQGLRKAGTISTTSPKHLTEQDVVVFLGWCKEHLDNSTSVKYLRYLGEVLQSSGNGSVMSVKSKYRRNLPKATPKPIRTLAADQVEQLLGNGWTLEDPFLDATAKAAIAIYLHTGLRSGELRHARLRDLDLKRMELVVSRPKGLGAWASGTEGSPIMPGVEPIVLVYLEARTQYLKSRGIDPDSVEALFPYVREDGKVVYWTQQLWTKMKSYAEKASGVRFKWKDLRPTFAQSAKDKGVPIEVVSKVLRHSSTVTTERFYSRVRSETAFSLMRQAWEAPVAEIPKR